MVIRLSELRPGDVLAHRFAGGALGAECVFSRVVRVGDHKVRVRCELGREAWMSPEYFHHRLPAAEARTLDV